MWFPQPPYLNPCKKGGAPFAVWSMDMIVQMRPVAPENVCNIIVAEDPFTKWVELEW